MATPPHDRPATQAKPGALGPARALALCLLWTALLAGLGWAADGQLRAKLTARTDGLVPVEHRADFDRAWLMLELKPEIDPVIAHDRLIEQARIAAEVLGDERRPLTPPAGAIETWLDRHVLWLAPVDLHPALAERLGPDAIVQAIADLRAEMASPAFAALADRRQRDPLGIRALLLAPSGGDRWLGPNEHGAVATAAGDLLAADERSLAIEVVSPRAIASLTHALRGPLDGGAVQIRWVGPKPRAELGLAWVGRAIGRALAIALAGLTVLLAIGLRRPTPALALVAGAATAVVAFVRVAPVLDPLVLPLGVALVGFSVDLGLRLHPFSRYGWASLALLALALAPLQLLDYPSWQAIALPWALAIAVGGFALRLGVRAMLELLADPVRWRLGGFVLRPMPWLALGLLAASAGVGSWAVGRWTESQRGAPGAAVARQRELDGLTLRDPAGEYEPIHERFVQRFFDPGALVEHCARGPSPEQALEAAAEVAPALAATVGRATRESSAPGSFVLGGPALIERAKSLRGLEIERALRELGPALAAQGLRPEAFRELGALELDPKLAPTARAALEGPLEPWLQTRLVARAGEHCALSRLELRRGAAGELDELLGEGAAALAGPRIASLHEAQRAASKLGLALAVAAWIWAFIVWLGTRSFALAVACAAVGLSTIALCCGLLVGFGHGLGAWVAPPLLLVGTAGVIASARAGLSTDQRVPLVAGGVLVTGACQCSAGLALLVSSEPIWRIWGLALGVGGLVAAGLGLFVAPGLTWLLRRTVGVGSPGPAPWDDDAEGGA